LNNKKIKLAIISSLDFKNEELLKSKINELQLKDDIKELEFLTVGSEKNYLIKNYAKKENIILNEIFPNYKNGIEALSLRNLEIIDNCDKMLIFWNGIELSIKKIIMQASFKNKDILITYYK